MGVTVRQAMEIWPLSQAELVAGAAGLDNEISWTHIVEVFEDPYFLSSGVLLCSTGYGFKDDARLQTSVMEHAGEVGIAAFVMKVGYELKFIPDLMLAHAERLSLPFLKLPQSIPFSDVTKSLAGLLLEKDAGTLRQAREILRGLMEAHLEGGGFAEITRTLGEALACSAFVTNRRGEMLSTYVREVPSSPTRDASTGAAPSSARDGGTSIIVHLQHYSQHIEAAAGLDRLFRLNEVVALPSGSDGGDRAAFIAPIRFERRMRGFVGVVRESKTSDLALWAIEAAALVAASEYRALRVEEDTEQRLVGNLLEALVDTDRPSDPTALRRLAAWGYDVGRPCRILLMEIEPEGEPARRGRSLEHLRPLLELYCRSDRYEPVIRFLGPSATALKQVPPDDLEHERQDLASFHSRVARHLRTERVWVAVGRPASPLTGLRATHTEAMRAMTVLRRTRPDGGVLCAEDLGIDNVLLDLSASPRARAYAHDVLAPLLEGGSTRGRSQLLDTLKTFIDVDADTQATADRLFLHPNTVRYRLKVIEDLTGLSLRSSRDRTTVTVALRLLDLGEQGAAGRGPAAAQAPPYTDAPDAPDAP